MKLAPIVLFCFNRPWHLTQTLNALKKNIWADQSHLHVFCDGPKANAGDKDVLLIKEVAQICADLNGFASVKIYKAQKNKGLQNSVIDGLNLILKEHEKAILVEDDVVTSKHFLQFMNNALEYYKDEKKVLSIGSWNYFYKPVNNFFNHMPDTIAWATWRNRWSLFEPDGKTLYDKLKQDALLNKFNLNGEFGFEKMLQMQIEGKVSSWAIRWTAVAVLNNTLSLYPKISLSKHIGFGTDSTNCEGEDYNKNLQLADHDISDFNIKVEEDKESVSQWLKVEQEIKGKSSHNNENARAAENIFFRIKRKIKSVFKTKPGVEKIYGWSGNYQTWDEVLKQSTGYDKLNILEKVKHSLLKVKNGEAMYERDSVAFEELEYSNDLLEAFKEIAEHENKELNLLDFGGSLGSTYYQYRTLLNNYRIKWSVVEQGHFVKTGKEFFRNESLDFYPGIDECIRTKHPSVILLSSVLAYLPKPHEFLKEVMRKNFKYVILYRTAFIDGGRDMLTLQTVPPDIYEASYPSWFFDEEKLLSLMKDKYSIIHEFKGDIESELMLDGQKAYWKGIVLKLSDGKL